MRGGEISNTDIETDILVQRILCRRGRQKHSKNNGIYKESIKGR